jgi:GNAT superfamily N-acetyltransferase
MLRIRKADAADVPTILSLIRELAAYEREPEAVVATEESLTRDGFGKAPRFHVLLASWDGETVGFAFYFFAYSTWRGSPVLYLEDVFVRPEHRRKGIGVALMRRLAALALEGGCERFAWQVLDWNTPALDFYKTLGARALPEWVTMRLEGDALRAFAASGSPESEEASEAS